MLDWEKLVRARLAGLTLDGEEKRDVIAELAAHLGETCDELLAKGVPEEEAARRALEQVADRKVLRRQIFDAKKREDIMQDRVRQLWFPGFLTLTLSMSLLMLFLRSGLQPKIVAWSEPGTVLFYVPWLITLPLFGALGAYLSQRAGGSKRAMLLSGVFPVLCLAACFFVILPISLIVDHQVPLDSMFQALLSGLIGWIVVPGAALLLGGLALQKMHSRESSAR
jgi:hypothetical protein